MVHFHWQFQSKSVYECIYERGSEEGIGKKGKKNNFQTLSLWIHMRHVNSIEKYNYYIYSFSISCFFQVVMRSVYKKSFYGAYIGP